MQVLFLSSSMFRMIADKISDHLRDIAFAKAIAVSTRVPFSVLDHSS